MYVLHLGIGDDFTFTPEGHAPVRLRIVGALADSFLQSELIIGEAGIRAAVPDARGLSRLDDRSRRRTRKRR